MSFANNETLSTIEIDGTTFLKGPFTPKNEGYEYFIGNPLAKAFPRNHPDIALWTAGYNSALLEIED